MILFYNEIFFLNLFSMYSSYKKRNYSYRKKRNQHKSFGGKLKKKWGEGKRKTLYLQIII